MAGQQFNQLTLIEFAYRDKRSEQYWKAICFCGNEKIVQLANVKRGATKSCGCLRVNFAKNLNIKHGRTPKYLYKTWIMMRTRCYNNDHKSFQYYGMRGITVKNQWVDDFIPFRDYILTYLGARPTKSHTLDRINNDGNYEPGNLKWSIAKEQANNRINNVVLEYDGQKNTIAQWAEIKRMTDAALRSRLKKYNWSIKKALTTPVKIYKSRYLPLKKPATLVAHL